MEHLWTGGPLPARYLQYVACAYLYHCKPDELAGMSLATIMEDYACLQAERRLGRGE